MTGEATEAASAREPISGIILAGGASRRMGRDKAFLELDGRPLIAHVAERLRTVTDELIIAANNAARFAPFADRVVPDVFPGIGTLGGIHAGLVAARHDLTLIVGCDMPFLNPELLRWFGDASVGYDLVILRSPEGLETLHAAYRRSCLPAIESAIRSGQRKAICFHSDVRVRTIDPSEISSIDPVLRSFQNLNTPSEWQAALAGWHGEASRRDA